jgi:hypothetical protein
MACRLARGDKLASLLSRIAWGVIVSIGSHEIMPVIRRFTIGQGSPHLGPRTYMRASAAKTWSCHGGGASKDDTFEFPSDSLRDAVGVSTGEDRLRFAAVLGITLNKLHAITDSGNEMRWRWGRNPGGGNGSYGVLGGAAGDSRCYIGGLRRDDFLGEDPATRTYTTRPSFQKTKGTFVCLARSRAAFAARRRESAAASAKGSSNESALIRNDQEDRLGCRAMGGPRLRHRQGGVDRVPRDGLGLREARSASRSGPTLRRTA